MEPKSKVAAAIDLDPFSDAAIKASLDTDALIRETAPVVWLEHYGLWGTGRYDVVKQILGNPESFSSARRPFSNPDFPLPAILVTDDAPGHTRVRKVMNGIFTPVLLKQLSERFRSVAETIVDRVSNQPSIDAVRDLVQPYILDVFGDAVGLPREGRHHLIPFGVAAINTFGPPNELFYQLVSQSSEGIPWVDAQCTSSTLAPDALGGLLYEASERGEVSKEEASLLMRNVLAAGVDTTVGVTANMLHAFARNPDQWELLRSNPKLAQAAFDEVQRWYSPSRMFGRVAHRDIELAGTTIAKDQGVLLFVAATGRDPRAWDEPERFDIRRSAGKHLSFGFGIHYCLGQMLARYEVLALLSVLMEKVARIDASGVPQALMNNTVQSFSSLPLRFELAPAGRD